MPRIVMMSAVAISIISFGAPSDWKRGMSWFS